MPARVHDLYLAGNPTVERLRFKLSCHLLCKVKEKRLCAVKCKIIPTLL